jgi:hypothetical protein
MSGAISALTQNLICSVPYTHVFFLSVLVGTYFSFQYT